MRKINSLLGLFLPLAVLTGCGVEGKWSLASVEPSAARRDFVYESLTLEHDGSFYAEAKEPETRTTSGVYRYNDGVLSLRDHDGVERAYTANRESADCLKLTQPWQDRKLVATLKRQP